MTVSISGNALRIYDFKTKDSDIVSYFAALPDDNLDNEIVRLLKMGILSQAHTSSMLSTQYVEKSFDGLNDKMANTIDRILAPNSEFTRLLEDYFGEERGVIKEVLDPDMDNTPLNRLRKFLSDELSEIKQTMAEQKGKQEGKQEEAKKGTQKGVMFEKICEPIICSMAESYSDAVESTGSTKGDLGASKKGDFVITLDNTEKKIVFEMKSQSSVGVPVIKKQLNEAMTNRGADYAVLVSRNMSALPREVGWFNEYDGNKLICALAETADDDENMWILNMAYRWSRIRVISDGEKELGIDPKVIKQGVNEIKNSLKRIAKINAQCKIIRKSTDTIETTINDENKKIQDMIDDIIHSMNVHGA